MRWGYRNIREKEGGRKKQMDKYKYEVEEDRGILINELDDLSLLEIKLDYNGDILFSISDTEFGLDCYLTDKEVNNLMFLLETMLKKSKKK